MLQYLKRYAEIEATCFDNFTCHYDQVICIPAFSESENFVDTLCAESSLQSVLIILVANAHNKASSQQINRTQAIGQYLKQQYTVKARYADNMHLLQMNNTRDILLVERCAANQYVPEKEGVGLARKIACDIACQLINLGKVHSTWIHSTDADAQLPAEYFEASKALNPKTDSAATYPFQHAPHPDRQVQLAQDLYDLSMLYYVRGLAWAGSPWAYHTIGSTLLINAKHYAQARGFPKRSAGEDFYLLNKLAKLGRIQALETVPVILESRLSDRVPFGTGPAVLKILAMATPLQEYLYYHPACFIYLKCWLGITHQLWQDNDNELTLHAIERYKSTENMYTGIDSRLLLDCMQQLGINKALQHAFGNSKTEQSFNQHLQNWFDSFMTLKFIHGLRDKAFESLPIEKVIAFEAIQHGKNLPFVACLADYDQALPA